MVKFDAEHLLRTARAQAIVFGVFTLIALVLNLYEITIPVDALIAIQTIAIWTHVMNLNSDLRSATLQPPDE